MMKKLKSNKFKYKRNTLLCLIGLVPLMGANSAPLDLSTTPAVGAGSHQYPAPNIIIAVDDSGSMDGARMSTLKSALKETFLPANVPDGSVRLAWQSMNSCYTIPADLDQTANNWSNGLLHCNNQNAMRVLDSQHRANFLDWVDKRMMAVGNTPTQRMLAHSGDYLQRFSAGDKNSPWADEPGVSWGVGETCRKSYILLMTDGGWNWYDGVYSSMPNSVQSLGNVDGTARTLPDSVAYDVNSNETRVFRDVKSVSGANNPLTVADLAMHFWATDLQPGMANNVKPIIRQTGTEVVGGVTVPEYWNPKNDPATWQHATLYTIGFQTIWGDNGFDPAFGTDTWTGGHYANLFDGSKTWRNLVKEPDMWHAAINGRGKYFNVAKNEDLVNAFKDFMSEVTEPIAPPPFASITASSANTRNDSILFLGSYTNEKWTGNLVAHDVAKDSAAVSAAEKWNAATNLDASINVSNRNVLSFNGTVGIPWKWASLSDAAKDELKTNPNTGTLEADNAGEARLNYIRGDRSQEAAKGGAFKLRDRASRLGDIVNSGVWVTPGRPTNGFLEPSYRTFRGDNSGREAMVYVGANDGMLHGFTALEGEERIAYMPQGLNVKLTQLTRPDYSHQYFVDSTPFTADIELSTGWHTYLAGFLGAGGKGYFVLDVTSPIATELDKVSTVILDKTATTDPDVGHIFNQVAMERSHAGVTYQMAILNNSRPALITGNGYNSTDENAVLLIQYLDGAKELKKIKATALTTKPGNGLSTPRLVDTENFSSTVTGGDSDRRPDFAYAGDLHGNLWKFDLTAVDDASWSVTSLVKEAVTVSRGVRQPITTAPTVLVHPEGGRMVIFGAGRNVTNADRTNTDTMGVFGVWDQEGASGIVGKNNLVEQTISTSSTTDASGNTFWSISANEVDYEKTDPDRGWYLELPSGERVLKNVQVFSENLLQILSEVPAASATTSAVVDSCNPVQGTTRKATFFSTVLDGIKGAAPKTQVYLVDQVSDKWPSRVKGDQQAVYLNKGDQAVSADPPCPVGSVCPSAPPMKYPPRIRLIPSFEQGQ